MATSGPVTHVWEITDRLSGIVGDPEAGQKRGSGKFRSATNLPFWAGDWRSGSYPDGWWGHPGDKKEVFWDGPEALN